MKLRKSLFVSLWIIALGIILFFSGLIIAGTGIIYTADGRYVLTWGHYLGVGMIWSGIIALVLGAFGIITTFIREYLDKGQKTAPSPPLPP